MNATCIVGSPRTGGSTACLIDTVIAGMEKAGVSAKKYNIGEENIRYCLGCKKCYETGGCVQKDSVEKIANDILASDLTVIAAPSYWAGIPGQLKAFIDRCTPYGDTNPNRRGKTDRKGKGIAIAVRAGARQEENALLLDAIQHFYGHLGIEIIRRISICETGTLADLLQKHGREVEEIYRWSASLPALLAPSRA